jgi:hypothetical protein
MLSVIFQAVEILVSFATCLASVWFLFLHANSSGIGNRGSRVNDGVSAIFVFLKLLVLVTVLREVSSWSPCLQCNMNLLVCDI